MTFWARTTVGTAFAALVSTAALGQNSNPHAAERGFGVDELVQGRWAIATDTDHQAFRAGIVAQTTDASLETGVLEFNCYLGIDGPRQRFTVRYWLAGGVTDEFEFALNLFNSSASRRPAAYDIGQGLIPTAHINFGDALSDPQPEIYLNTVADFRDQLEAATRGAVTIIFMNPRGVAPVATLVFPAAGFAEAIKGHTAFCPG